MTSIPDQWALVKALMTWWRRTPSDIVTDLPFSDVSWWNEVKAWQWKSLLNTELLTIDYWQMKANLMMMTGSGILPGIQFCAPMCKQCFRLAAARRACHLYLWCVAFPFPSNMTAATLPIHAACLVHVPCPFCFFPTCLRAPLLPLLHYLLPTIHYQCCLCRLPRAFIFVCAFTYRLSSTLHCIIPSHILCLLMPHYSCSSCLLLCSAYCCSIPVPSSAFLVLLLSYA